MNANANAMPTASSNTHAMPAAQISMGRRFYWSLRRELWENRAIYLAPACAAGLVLIGALLGAAGMPHRLRNAALDPMVQHHVLEQPYMFAALLIMLSTTIVALFYCMDALHGERRDRTILFWKSMPVSDLTTVLAKAIVPIILLPAVTFAITVVTQACMLLIFSARMMSAGVSVAEMWHHLALGQMWGMLLFHLVAIHGLWYAPVYGWLLLVSAWAKRMPWLWATLPLLAVGIVEKIAFNSSYLANWLAYRVNGPQGDAVSKGAMQMNSLMRLTFGEFLLTPGLWTGLAATAIFVVVAARLRRSAEGR